jgi:hypothetical protein
MTLLVFMPASNLCPFIVSVLPILASIVVPALN